MYKIKNFNKENENIHKIIKIINIILCICIIPIIIYNATLMIKSIINPNKIPDFWGFKTFVIISESMEPNIMPGDAIIVKNINQNNLNVGDIISFHDIDYINTHRIVEIINENGLIRYKTKGDNNKREDRNLVAYKNVEGKYLLKIKGFGKFIEVIQSKVTLVILLLLLVIILTYQTRINKRKLKRNEKRYEYNKKILEESKNTKP